MQANLSNFCTGGIIVVNVGSQEECEASGDHFYQLQHFYQLLLYPCRGTHVIFFLSRILPPCMLEGKHPIPIIRWGVNAKDNAWLPALPLWFSIAICSREDCEPRVYDQHKVNLSHSKIFSRTHRIWQVMPFALYCRYDSMILQWLPAVFLTAPLIEEE